MQITLIILIMAFVLTACYSQNINRTDQSELSKFAPKPLYRDPIYDGAADPSVIWNQREKRWFMFYTNRRANVEGLEGVQWVHGTPIGIAESEDGGATWRYRQNAIIKMPESNPTYWAPDVIATENEYHMFLTVVPGIFNNWNHPRKIMQLSSDDLINWRYIATLQLNSDRVIDAEVVSLPQGGYRLFYNDEPDGKSIYYADSKDLYSWEDRGKVNMQSRGEGPAVFYWRDFWWMMIDSWSGLSVFRSRDLQTWQPQSYRLLEQPGQGGDDQVKGGHADVVISDDRAYLFYFTHPGRTIKATGRDDYTTRRSSIQVTELQIKDAWLTCDRNLSIPIHLQPK